MVDVIKEAPTSNGLFINALIKLVLAPVSISAINETLYISFDGIIFVPKLIKGIGLAISFSIFDNKS